MIEQLESEETKKRKKYKEAWSRAERDLLKNGCQLETIHKKPFKWDIDKLPSLSISANED